MNMAEQQLGDSNVKQRVQSPPFAKRSSSELIVTARHKIRKEIEQDGQIQTNEKPRQEDYNLDQTIQVINALLAVNTDIFDRIMKNVSNDTGRATFFFRYGYETVNVEQAAQHITRFTTYVEKSLMPFDLTKAKSLPADISLLQPIFRTDYTSFIDYELFLEKAIGALHEDVLLPFLIKLKNHLERVQVAFGDVEGWLLDAQINTRFLESIFDKQLEHPFCASPVEVYTSFLGPELAPSQLCLNCCQPFICHQTMLIHGLYYKRCISPCLYPLSDGLTRFYTYYSFVLLKECHVGVQFNLVFNISQATEQKRLKLLLEFMMYS